MKNKGIRIITLMETENKITLKMMRQKRSNFIKESANPRR